MNWVDFTIIGIVAVSAIISLMRGFVREAMSLVTWIIAFYIGFKFAVPLSVKLVPYIQAPMLRMLTSFIILFVVALALGTIVSHLFSQVVRTTGLTGTDRLIGVVFGGARGVILVAVFLLIAQIVVMPEKQTWWSHSQLIPRIYPLVTWIHDNLPNNLNHFIEQINQTPTSV